MDADPIGQTDDDDIFDFATALMQNKTIEECKVLLDGITRDSINARDSQGYTRLEWATAFARCDFRHYLITKGATSTGDRFHRNVQFIALQYVDRRQWNDTMDLSGANATNDTALHLALYGAKWDLVTAILKLPDNDDVNAMNSSDEMPLHLAAKSKCGARTFKQIVRRTTRINTFDAYGYTALHWAASEGSAKKIQSLLDGGADVNAQSKGDGNTALHLALVKKSNTAAEELLKCDELDVDVKGKGRWTALHQAAAWNTIPADLFQKILQKSSDVNAKTILGRTALHVALRKRSATSIEALLNCGHNNNHNGPVVDVGDGHGKTALHYAAEWQGVPVRLFKNIVQQSANVNAIEKVEDATALHFALVKRSITATRHLLERADVKLDLKNKKHFVPLHHAAQWCDIPPPLFDAILNKTIDLNATEKTRGLTALHLAIDARSQTAITQLLKHENVDVHVEDNQKRTATHLMDSWPDVPPDLRLLWNIRLRQLNDTPDHEQSIGQDSPTSETIAVKENELRQRCHLVQLNEHKCEAPPDPERSLNQRISFFSTLSLILLLLVPLAVIIFAKVK